MGWFGWVEQAIQLFQLNGRDGLWLPPPTNKPTTHNSLSLPSTCLIEKRNEEETKVAQQRQLSSSLEWIYEWKRRESEQLQAEHQAAHAARQVHQLNLPFIQWSEAWLKGRRELNGRDCLSFLINGGGRSSISQREMVGAAPRAKKKTSPQFTASSSSCGAQPTREEELVNLRKCWLKWIEWSWLMKELGVKPITHYAKIKES